MTSEPLTVEELERVAREIVSMISPFVSTSEAFEERCTWVKGRLRQRDQSHSRQLWLEAAEIPMEWANSKSCDYHDSSPCCHVRTGAEIARRLRAKAESTPKPSPALPSQENL